MLISTTFFEMDPNDKFLNWGYKAAILLSFLGMIGSAIYLFVFQLSGESTAGITDHVSLLGITANMQMRLLSTAIFVGMSFGFLGFALFLIQAKGATDVAIDKGDFKLNFTKLSPGLFVILCATAIIILASTYKIGFSLETVPQQVPATNTTKEKEEPDTIRVEPLNDDLLGIPGSND